MKNAELITVALRELFVHEVIGDGDNPRILQYAKDCGFANYKHDSIAWCSLFMNWLMFQCDCKMTGSLLARSWLKLTLKVSEPVIGDIMIFWRDKPDGVPGHVGLFINTVIHADGSEWHRIISGNETDQVKISEMPATKLLGIRVPEEIE